MMRRLCLLTFVTLTSRFLSFLLYSRSTMYSYVHLNTQLSDLRVNFLEERKGNESVEGT